MKEGDEIVLFQQRVLVQPSEPFVRYNQFADSNSCMEVSVKALPRVPENRVNTGEKT